MTKVYVMETCPDCIEVKQRYSGNPDFELVDIGTGEEPKGVHRSER